MIKVGILGCSEIAFRRFMPAVKEVKDVVASVIAEEYAPEKLATFCQTYEIEKEESFQKIIERKDIDAVYIPQPPSLHYKWAKEALEHGKHVLVEKPSALNYGESKELVELAKEKNLALHENYMFVYHSQIREIIQMIEQGEIGEVRLIRCNFGFPLREKGDFRYIKNLGGGALLDAGGYTAKLATLFLGDSIKVDTSQLSGLDGFEVDMYGSATFSNKEGTICQVGFGMDCQYMCSLDIWGSKGRLTTNRIFTAPVGYEPVIQLESDHGSEKHLEADSSFERSIEQFAKEIVDEQEREKMYQSIVLQSKLVDDMRRLGM